MSSTNGKVAENEAYATPVPVVQELLKHLEFRNGDCFLEPCKGEGNIYDNVPLPVNQKSWAELRLGVDYLQAEFDTQDVIITNPPFSLTCEFITKSLSELAADGTMVYLQRVNFLGSKKRVEFWKETPFPNKSPVIIPRPRFANGGSDSCEYMWYIWDKGNRFKSIPNGLSHLIHQQ